MFPRLDDSQPAHVSRLQLERLAAGELAGETRELVDQHVAACEQCRERVTDIERDNAQFATAIDVRAAIDMLLRAVAQHRPWYQRPRVLTTTSLFAAACIALLVVGLRRGNAPLDEDGIRRKGGVALEIIRRDLRGRVEPIASGDRLHPGEAIRFRVKTAKPGHLVILGIDIAQVITPYAGSLEISPARPLLVDGSIILDDTLGPERIVAIVCATRIDPRDLVERARAELVRAGGNPRAYARTTADCQEDGILIEKVPSNAPVAPEPR